jgi:hypothetical protein
MLPQFQPELVMKHLLHQEGIDVNLFMAVPTIYAKLIEHIRGLKPDPDLAQKLKKNVRLMVSGSAALPQVSGLFLWRHYVFTIYDVTVCLHNLLITNLLLKYTSKDINHPTQKVKHEDFLLILPNALRYQQRYTQHWILFENYLVWLTPSSSFGFTVSMTKNWFIETWNLLRSSGSL